MSDKDAATRQMVELYQKGMSLEDVGKQFGLTKQGVRYRFMKAGISRREKFKNIDIDKGRLAKLYLEDKMSVSKIAGVFSVSETAIRHRLQHYQIPKRDRIKNGGCRVDFLRSLKINEQRIFEYQGNDEYAHLHTQAKLIGIKITTKKLTAGRFAVTRID